LRCSFGGGKGRKTGVKSCVNWYDYGARFYDASLGRWHVKDPLCEYAYNMTPYHYVTNNPMNYIDPFGLKERKWWQFWKPKEEEPKPFLPVDDIGEVTVSGEDRSGIRSENEESRFRNFLNWLNGIDKYVTGNHNPRNVRDADSGEKWIQRNCDQEVVNELGQAFGHPSISPTNENVVTNGDHFRRRNLEGTSDKEIGEKTGNNTRADGKPKNENIVTVDTMYVRESGSQTFNQESAYNYGFKDKVLIYSTTTSKKVDSMRVIK
jgi:RHS repeat-associated protein